MTPLISLVITIYNRQDYLKTAIKSVQAQTWQDFELLLWDDGSTDNSLEICQEYAHQDSRIKVFAAKHQGRVKALNAACQEVQGTYLSFVDSDDYLASTALEETVAILNSQPEIGVVYTDYLDIDKNGNFLGYGKRCQTPYSRQALIKKFITFHFRLIRRSVFKKVEGIDEFFQCAMDYDLCLRLSEITQFYHLKKPLYYYRNHLDSISFQQRQQQIYYSREAAKRSLMREKTSPPTSLLLKERGEILGSSPYQKERREISDSPSYEGGVRGGKLIASACLAGLLGIEGVVAQPITPANDGVGTTVTQNGNQFDINGGTLSGDGQNLFHSLEQFGLDANQIANFISTPEIYNILGRIVGGDPSIINGLIQVTGGNSNLFLMNPAGFVFGSGATLNVTGDFTATTANKIGFEQGWFSTFDPNNYQTLVGNPNQFAFTLSQSGNLINAGNLSVLPGASITLLGGNIINTGTISTPGGTITLTAIDKGNRVRISQQGSVLSLDIDAAALESGNFSPLDLPALLTGSNPNTGLTVNPDNSVTLNSSQTTIPSESGTAIASGTLNTSNPNSQGGNINVFGERVGLLEANINASGINGGGNVRIGGDYQGQGDSSSQFTVHSSPFSSSSPSPSPAVPTSENTVVDSFTIIQADGTITGNGGTVIVWSDETTQFAGKISATGGSNGGDGGFAEVSGKQTLVFQGLVDLTSPTGNTGTLLLDPTDITISNNADTATILPFDGGTFDDNTATPSNLNITTLENQLALSDVTVSTASGLAANGGGDITVNNEITWDSDNSLTLDADDDIIVNAIITATGNNGDLNLQADGDIIANANLTTNSGSITLETTNFGNITTQNIETNGGNISLTATSETLSTESLDTSSLTGNSGNITINLLDGDDASTITITGDINTSAINGNGGDITINSSVNDFGDSAVTITGNIDSFSNSNNSGSITISSFSPDGDSTVNITGDIDSSSNNNSGAIDINSEACSDGNCNTFGDVTTTSSINISGSIDASSNSNSGGNVILESNTCTSGGCDNTSSSIVTGNINTSGNSGTGGQVDLSSSANSNYGGTGVSNLVANSTITTGTLTSTSTNGSGGQITLDSQAFSSSTIATTTSTSTVTTDDITAASTSNTGGQIDLNSGTFSSSDIETSTINPGNITSSADGGSGNNITLSSNINGSLSNLGATATLSDNSSIEAGNGTINFDNVAVNANGNSLVLSGDEIDLDTTNSQTIFGGGILTFKTGTVAQDILVGEDNNNTDANTTALDLTEDELALIGSGFDLIIISSEDNAGTVTLFNTVTDTGTTPFQVPVNIAGGSTLVSPPVATTWNITGVDQGDLNTLFVNSLTFASIENLVGSDFDDTFEFDDGGSISESIDGGAENTFDTLDYSNYTSALIVDLSTFTLINIEQITGTTNAPSTLIGSDTNNTWNINSSDSGTFNTDLFFTSFQNLTGGSLDDTFNFNVLSEGISGTVDGGETNNTNTLNYSTFTTDIEINLANNTATATGGINNITAATGGSGNNTLTGSDIANQWTITGGDNNGNLNGTFTFTAFQNLVGGNDADTFTLSGSGVDNLDGSGGDNTLIGDEVANSWNLTEDNGGTLNASLTFANIQNLTGGSDNDNFIFSNGVTVSGIVEGSGGSNSLDYSNTTNDVAINLDNNTATATGGINNITAATGGSGNNTLTGSDIANQWTITGGDNSGNLNGTFTFTAFQNLVGGSNTDTFTLSDGSTVANVDGSGGENTLVGNDTPSNWNLTVGNGGNIDGVLAFSNIQNLTGGSDNDSFIFADAVTIDGLVDGGGGTNNSLNYSAYTTEVKIDLDNNLATGTGGIANINTITGGSSGDNTLISTDTANTWEITGADAVVVNGTLFTFEFQNLTGGDATDTFTFRDGQSVTGVVEGGGGINTLDYTAYTTDVTVNLSNNTATGTGGISNINNVVGANSNNNTFIASNATNTWNIGDTLTLNGAVTFTAFQSLVGGSANDIFILDGGNISTLDGGEGNNTLQGENVVNTWNITTEDGGTLNNTLAFTNIQSLTGNSANDTFAFIGNAASVTGNLDGGDGTDTLNFASFANEVTLTVGTTETGNAITTNNSQPLIVALTSIENAIGNTSFTNTLIGENNANIWRITGSGDIDNQQFTWTGFDNLVGGSDTDTFIFVGGTAVTIDGAAGDNTLVANNAENTWEITGNNLGTLTTGAGIVDVELGSTTLSSTTVDFANIQNLTGSNTDDIFRFVGDAQIDGNLDGIDIFDTLDYRQYEGETIRITLGRDDPGTATGVNGTINSIERIILDDDRCTANIDCTKEPVDAPPPVVPPLPLDFLTEQEDEISRDFEDYLGLGESQRLTKDEIIELLVTVEKNTGIKPSLLYIRFSPTLTANENAVLELPTDELELFLVTTEGTAVRRRVPGVTRQDVLNLADTFRSSITNTQDNYLEPSQQLYQWLITPLENSLVELGIGNIAFVMEAGLRSLPVAALHDGENFIIEKYSVGLMPSISLIDTRYVDIRDTEVLAMGSSEFQEQNPLPAVPVEVEAISQNIWNGEFFLNEEFTIQKLQQARNNQPFGIIHLATHGEFLSGEPGNSYIQFWDQKLRLDQIRQLGLHDPPAELLVLSACQTALGDPEAELGFAGLAIQAGVKTALGSLWHVSDEGTLGLMTSFYEQLKLAPIKAEALRQAQLAMINGDVRIENGNVVNRGLIVVSDQDSESNNSNITQNLNHPYFWSAFTVIGNPW